MEKRLSRSVTLPYDSLRCPVFSGIYCSLICTPKIKVSAKSGTNPYRGWYSTDLVVHPLLPTDAPILPESVFSYEASVTSLIIDRKRRVGKECRSRWSP